MKYKEIYIVGIIWTFIMLGPILVSSYGKEAGVTSRELTGREQNSPSKLKGSKVYWIWTRKQAGNGVHVAISNNKVNFVTFPVGKSQQTTVLLNSQSNKLITVKQILLENDSLIICRK